MSAELGVGVRVWVGWTHSGHLAKEVDCEPRCRKGRIENGPFGPGLIRDGDGRLFRIKRRVWNVTLDDGHMVGVAEDLLYPLDDGEPEAQPENQHIRQPAEA